MLRSKTMWAALAAVVTACGSYFSQDISLAEMMQICVTSVLAIFLRHGVAKAQTVAELAVETAKAAAAPPPELKKKAKKAD